MGKDERWRGMRGVESCESVDGEKVAVSRICYGCWGEKEIGLSGFVGKGGVRG